MISAKMLTTVKAPPLPRVAHKIDRSEKPEMFLKDLEKKVKLSSLNNNLLKNQPDMVSNLRMKAIIRIVFTVRRLVTPIMRALKKNISKETRISRDVGHIYFWHNI